MAKSRTIEDSSDEDARSLSSLDLEDDVEDREEDEDEEDEDEDEELDDDDEEDDDSEEPDEDGSAQHMTARQRSKRGDLAVSFTDIAELGPSRSKKSGSAEEQKDKRAEMARRRRNLSQQRLEEEKQETLDKLLKKRATKVRGAADEEGLEPQVAKSRLVPPHPALSSWCSVKDQFTLSLTSERAEYEGL